MKKLSALEIQDRRDTFYQELRRDLAKQCKRFDSLSTEVCFNIAQTYARLDTKLAEQALPTGLTLPGINVLVILFKHGETGCPLNALSHLLVVSRANITGLVDSLVRKNLVTRTEHVKDRRVLIARITKKGKDLLESYMPTHYGMIRDMADSLTHGEKETIIRLLTKLRHRIVHLRDQ